MSTDTREKTCEDRISAHLESREADIARLHERIAEASDAGNYDRMEEFEQELNEMPLSIEIKTKMVVLLSWGGPSDQFEVAIEKGQHGWELADNAATYRFLDWFDGAERRTDHPAVMAWLESMVECMGLD